MGNSVALFGYTLCIFSLYN